MSIEIIIGDVEIGDKYAVSPLSSQIFFGRGAIPLIDYIDEGMTQKQLNKWVKEGIKRKCNIAFLVPSEKYFHGLKNLKYKVKKIIGQEWGAEEVNLMDILAFIVNEPNREMVREYLVSIGNSFNPWIIIKFFVSNLTRFSRRNQLVIKYISKLLLTVDRIIIIDLFCYHMEVQPQLKYFKYCYTKKGEVDAGKRFRT